MGNLPSNIQETEIYPASTLLPNLEFFGLVPTAEFSSLLSTFIDPHPSSVRPFQRKSLTGVPSTTTTHQLYQHQWNALFHHTLIYIEIWIALMRNYEPTTKTKQKGVFTEVRVHSPFSFPCSTEYQRAEIYPWYTWRVASSLFSNTKKVMLHRQTASAVWAFIKD